MRPDSAVQVASGLYRIGAVLVDSRRREVKVDGVVNMDRGPVELLACARRGKTHESVLVLDGEPHHIQVGLMLLGLEPADTAGPVRGRQRAPVGDRVEITVSWTDSAGRAHRARGEELLFDQKTDRVMKRTHWVFVGSKVVNGLFLAQLEGSIVTVYWDPATIVDNALPGGADDTVYRVNTDVVPAAGTPVTLTIHAPGPYRHRRNAP